MVYFIRAANGLIKIGHSTLPAGRLATFRTASAVDLELVGAIPGDIDEERELHGIFWGQLHHGEWFRPSTELHRLIDASEGVRRKTKPKSDRFDGAFGSTRAVIASQLRAMTRAGSGR